MLKNKDYYIEIIRGIVSSKLFKKCIIYTFVIGLIAHGYGFLNLTISGDSLTEFYLSGLIYHKIALGRFAAPIFTLLLGGKIVLPWTFGLISLFLIGLSVYLISTIFNISRNIDIFVVAGIMTVNQCSISLFSTYLHDSMADTFALLCSVLSAYFLIKSIHDNKIPNGLFGVLFIIISLACYQAYISVTLTILILYLIRSLINNEASPKKMILCGIQWICILGIGSVSYLLTAKGIMKIVNAEYTVTTYNSLSKMQVLPSRFVSSLAEAYVLPLHELTNPDSFIWPTRTLRILLACWFITLTTTFFIRILKNRNSYKLGHYLLFLLLIILIPLCVNIAHLLVGMSHDLMHYAFCLVLCAPILIFRGTTSSNGSFGEYSILAILIELLVIILCNIQTANAVYVKKDFERQHGLFEMTKLITNIEHQEGYQYGQTKVAFIGTLPGSCVPGTNRICTIMGCFFHTPTDGSTYKAYCRTYLQYDINHVDEDMVKEIQKSNIYKDRPRYPDPDGIFFIDDVLVVKM